MKRNKHQFVDFYGDVLLVDSSSNKDPNYVRIDVSGKWCNVNAVDLVKAVLEVRADQFNRREKNGR